MPREPLRTLRVDDALWSAVQAKAAAEGRGVSEVIRELLTRWAARPPKPPR